MDVKTAAWLSNDPMGNTDSQNLYAYVGLQPNMGIDPLGRYQADVHAGITYFLAVKAGMTEEDANRLAWWDEWVDSNPETNPTSNPRSGNWIPLYKFHFPIDSKTGRVEPATGAVVRPLGRARNLAQLGIALHVLQDSFGHFPAYPGNIVREANTDVTRRTLKLAEAAGQVKDPERGVTHMLLREPQSVPDTVRALHEADYTFLRPELAEAMEEATFDAIVRYLVNVGQLTGLEGEQRLQTFCPLTEALHGFNAAATISAKKNWLAVNAGARAVEIVPWTDLTLPKR
jgi:hypothetical protein